MASNKNSKPRAFERIDQDMGCILSPKPTINLMQNCDLPPPMKLFSCSDETFRSSINNWRGHETKKNIILHMYKDFSGNNDKLEILKALRLSQTRAREAERKLRILSKEKEMLSNALVDESLRLFAYRQWVNLLELKVFKTQTEQQEENRQSYYSGSNCAEKSEASEEGTSSKSWCAAIAFCLAIAGMGFAIGCKYLF